MELTFILTVDKINRKFCAAGGNCVLCQGGDYVCQNVRILNGCILYWRTDLFQDNFRSQDSSVTVANMLLAE